MSQEVPEKDITYDDNDRVLYKKIQMSMNQSGVTEYIIKLICNYKENPEPQIDISKSSNLEEFMNKDRISYAYLNEAINLLIKLLNNQNTKIQEFILKYLKKNSTVGFFHYIQERLVTGYVQKDSSKSSEGSGKSTP